MNKVGWTVEDISELFPDKVRHFGYIHKIPYFNLKFLQLHRINPNINLSKYENFVRNNKIYITRVDFNVTTQNPIHDKLEKLLESHSFKQVPWCNSPTKTLVIDLKKHSINQLYNSLKHKTRYNINKSIKLGVILKKYNLARHRPSRNETRQFWKLVKETLSANSLPSLSLDQFILLLNNLKSNAVLFLAFSKNNKRINAGVLYIKTNNTLYYTLNGSTDLGKKLFSPTLLVWEGIKYSHEKFLDYFDFEGIYDERNTQLTSSWKGFSKFKQSFPGTPIEYMLPYQKVHLTRYEKINSIIKIITNKYSRRVYPSVYPTIANIF